VVTPINVGASGTVTLSATEGVTLGGKVTAGTLTVTAGDDLTITSEVGTLQVTMNGAGDLTVFQTGALSITSIAMNGGGGGDVNLVASGTVDIGEITGVAGDIKITTTAGNIVIGKLAAGGDLVLSAAAGKVTLGSASNTIEADSLNIVAKGDITVYEKDALVIERLSSSDGGVVFVKAGGALTVNGAIQAKSGNDVSLETTNGGSIALNQTITTETGGNVTITAANGLTLSAQADIKSTNGVFKLNAGSGALTMTGETYVDAGSGTLDLDATGTITLGKLSTLNTAAVTITSTAGAVLDGGDSPVDVYAPNARLEVRSVGGFGGGSYGALETQVAELDVINSGSGDIAVEDVDDLIIVNISQSAAGGKVDISLLISVETWYCSSSQMSAMMKSGAPISRFFFSLSLILTTSTSLCVRSSSDLSPVSRVMLGLTVTGGIGSIVSTNHSGLPPFIFIIATSSSVIFSSLCLTSSDVSSSLPSLNDVGFWYSISFCFSPQCGQVIFLFL